MLVLVVCYYNCSFFSIPYDSLRVRHGKAHSTPHLHLIFSSVPVFCPITSSSNHILLQPCSHWAMLLPEQSTQKRSDSLCDIQGPSLTGSNHLSSLNAHQFPTKPLFGSLSLLPLVLRFHSKSISPRSHCLCYPLPQTSTLQLISCSHCAYPLACSSTLPAASLDCCLSTFTYLPSFFRIARAVSFCILAFILFPSETEQRTELGSSRPRFGSSVPFTSPVALT